ncbi:NACHT domain-containing protein [Rhypophila decipiens]|uniref:NACHT domain-containing protein n=1 Tax=Rhypophila decipiens TaxID=261697 RepID=A0AAN7B339_9PEZI|nr:NACHT domain-containing protein [Rhypophila decipiens]
MEPLSIVAIAGAVMQVITFSKDMIDLYRNIKKNESIGDGLEGKSAQIATNARLIQDNLAKTSGGPLDEADTALHDVANKCLGCSKALTDVMNNIKWKTMKKKGSMTLEERGALGQAWKVQRYKSEIEKLGKDLKHVQETMKGTILVSSQGRPLWLNTTKDSTNWIARSSSSSSARPITTTEMLDNQIVGQAKTQIDREQRLLFLGSLQFSTMRERKSRVSEAHDKTFRWIFDKNIPGPWDSFNTWLKSEEQVYWISGKPGSGKSTLMKYLVDHDKTENILQEWDPTVSILSFFLWNSGDKLQKSVQGLLCALLSQILQPDEDLTCTLLAGDPGLLEKRSYNDWSDDELEALLTKAIMTSKRRVVMFLDGLDEIDRKEGPFPVLQLLKTLESKTHAKLCLSSRPKAQFQDALGKRRTLRLEDLTRKDIGEYVEDYFQEHLNFWGGDAAESQVWRERIIYEILMRASGVFLWVFLVLRSLRSGTSNLHSYDQLLHRVRQLPSSLEQLYRQSWERLGEDEQIYRDEAASYFKLVLLSQQMMENLNRQIVSSLQVIPLSFLEFLLAHDSHLREGLLDSHLIPPANVLISKVHVLQRHIETRSGGLLEVFRSADSTPGYENMERFFKSCFKNFLNQFLVHFSAFLSSGEGGSGAPTSGRKLAELWNISHALSVGFIHRTAADFVSNTDWGNKLMCGVQKSDLEILTGLCEARLAHGVLYMFPDYQYSYDTISADACDFLQLFDQIQSGISQEQYISLCKSLEQVYTQLIGSSPKVDRLIDDLSTQILQGEFDSDYYKVMHEFIESGLIHSFELIWGKDDKASPSFARTTFRVIQDLPNLADMSRQILANCRSGRPDPQAGCSSASDLPLFPLPDSILSPSTSMPRISAHVVFSAWVLADSRDLLRHQTVQLLGQLSIIATASSMSDCLQRYMDRWPHIYKTTKGFSKALMSSALSEELEPRHWVGQNSCIRQLLSIGEDPNWVKPPSLRTSVPLSHFEWFLLRVPDICQKEEVMGIESSIISTVNAFLAAGARLDGRIYLAFGGPFPVPLRPLEFNDSKDSGPYFYAFQPEDMEIVAERFKFESSRSPEDWIEGGSNFTMKTREDIASTMSKPSIMSKGGKAWNAWWQNENGYKTERPHDIHDTILFGSKLKHRKAGSHLYEKWFPEWAKMTTSHAHIHDEQEMMFM